MLKIDDDHIDMVALTFTKEQLMDIQLAKLEKVSRDDLVRGCLRSKARDLFRTAKMLRTHFGKEKAIDMLEQVQTEDFCAAGQAASRVARKNDINGYIEVFIMDFLQNIPAAPPCEIVEKTDKRLIYRNSICYHADAVMEFGKDDPETLDIVKCFCTHDKPWAEGFNPAMRFERTKFVLDGDDCCEFLLEID
ncbi:MAG: L-2-amino-thiazoline-4-carboxylic acid hydrolase [Deltaproteobacteria bacterium]|nr:L-2-amino-thiazoline-4-carboxylic acid hydrolase [Deltaproteobacteria bacterium]